MKTKSMMTGLMAATFLGGTLAAPLTASAQDWRDKASSHRQQTKNQWRNIAIGAGALGVLGLLKHDNTLTFAGTAGALYSLNRYEQDRKSQSAHSRARANWYHRHYPHRYR